MQQATIRIGIIGAGANTRALHIPKLQALSGVEIVSVANRTPTSARKVAKQFGIQGVAGSWEDIVYDPDIDAVCIGTWPYMHAPLAIAALEAEKHVLCEARMAMNSIEAHAMLDVARMHPNLIAQVVPAPHTLEFDRTIAERIAKGRIGDLIAVDARMSADTNFPQWDSPANWRHDRELSGNNIMYMGIWYESIMRWVGPAKSVQALGQNVVRHRLDDAGRRVAMTIPDHVDVICEMEQGGQLRLCLSAVVGLVPEVDVYVCGTEGTLRLSDNGGGLTLEAGRRGRKSLSRVKIANGRRGGWRVEEEFINAIRGRETITHTTFADGVKYMEWTDAVTKALRTGEKVHLPLEVDY